jgi:dihydroorotase
VLAPGRPADLVVLDEHAPWQVIAEAMPGSAGNTPFDGLPVQGRVLRLFKGGREL